MELVPSVAPVGAPQVDELSIFVKTLDICMAEGIKAEPNVPHLCTHETCIIRELSLNVFACVRQGVVAHVCFHDELTCPTKVCNGIIICAISNARLRDVQDALLLPPPDDLLVPLNFTHPVVDPAAAPDRPLRQTLVIDAKTRVLDPIRSVLFATPEEKQARWRAHQQKIQIAHLMTPADEQRRNAFAHAARVAWNEINFSATRRQIDRNHRQNIVKSITAEAIRTANTLFRRHQMHDGDGKRTKKPRATGGPISIEAFYHVIIRAVNKVRCYALSSEESRRLRCEKFNILNTLVDESFPWLSRVRSALLRMGVSDRAFSDIDFILAWAYIRDSVLIHTECVSQDMAFELGLEEILPHPLDLGELRFSPSDTRVRRLRCALGLCGLKIRS